VTEPRTRRFRVTKPNSYQSAAAPCHGQIRIERESPINEGGTVIKFMDDIRQCKPAIRERGRVLLAQGYGSPG
jgi:hypothetical protein